MCRFGCSTANQQFKCKHCGTPYCASCGKGAWSSSAKGLKSGGVMRAGNVCGECGGSNHRGDKL